jgi:hypothetical protein
MLSEIIADVRIFVISSTVRTLDVNISVYVCMIEKLVYVVGRSSDKVKICGAYCCFSVCYFVVVLNTLTVMTFIFFFVKVRYLALLQARL